MPKPKQTSTTKRPKLSKARTSDRIEDVAKRLGADEARFEAKLRNIVKVKPKGPPR